jgi:hypothetical protein
MSQPSTPCNQSDPTVPAGMAVWQFNDQIKDPDHSGWVLVSCNCNGSNCVEPQVKPRPDGPTTITVPCQPN